MFGHSSFDLVRLCFARVARFGVARFGPSLARIAKPTPSSVRRSISPSLPVAVALRAVRHSLARSSGPPGLAVHPIRLVATLAAPQNLAQPAPLRFSLRAPAEQTSRAVAAPASRAIKTLGE
ncbi:hypothetical protein [Burkholderia pseudomallei]|uniref:hypothetical protein n=1 Tax=Burkholderia pseudomallei TaxID=28450 RepID=UPI0011C4E71D|nr:hypothetical protein [Burkholderia pseudomallei]